MASWDLEEGGWLWLLPQWQSLEEEMGVVFFARGLIRHISSRGSYFLTLVPLPGLFGLMSLLLNICFFYL